MNKRMDGLLQIWGSALCQRLYEVPKKNSFMHYRRAWILCILVISSGILLGLPGTMNTMINQTPMELSDSDSPAYSGGTNHFFPEGSLWDLPPVPRFYREPLPAGIDCQWIDLSWNNVNNPHMVVIYTPDTTLGPFRNMDNGVADRRIFLEIFSGSNLTPGPWYYQVRSSGTSTQGTIRSGFTRTGKILTGYHVVAGAKTVPFPLEEEQS